MRLLILPSTNGLNGIGSLRLLILPSNNGLNGIGHTRIPGSEIEQIVRAASVDLYTNCGRRFHELWLIHHMGE